MESILGVQVMNLEGWVGMFLLSFIRYAERASLATVSEVRRLCFVVGCARSKLCDLQFQLLKYFDQGFFSY